MVKEVVGTDSLKNSTHPLLQVKLVIHRNISFLFLSNSGNFSRRFIMQRYFQSRTLSGSKASICVENTSKLSDNSNTNQYTLAELKRIR